MRKSKKARKEEQEKALEEWRKKVNEGMEEELAKDSQEGEETMTHDLAPLVPPPFPPLVPLTGGGTPEEVAFFPESK